MRCDLCPLHEGVRFSCIEGRGSLAANILVLGQAPGRREDQTGQVFVGQSGELLEFVLEEAGLTVRLENVVRCMPPGNRAPKAAEIKACLPYLEQVVRKMRNLECIITLGSVPLKAVTGKGNITNRVGDPVAAEFFDRKVIAIPNYHPAYVLRSRSEAIATRFEEVIQSTPTIMQGVDSNFVRILKGKSGIEKLRSFINNKSPIAFDLETTGIDPTCNSIISVSFYRGRKSKSMKPVSILVDNPRALELLREFYLSKTPKVYHTVFEYAWGKYHLGVEMCNPWCDTAILSKRVDSDRPVRLSVLSSIYSPAIAGFKIDSNTALEEGELWVNMSRKVLQTRNAIDSFATFEAYEAMRKQVGEDEFFTHRTVDIPTSHMVRRIQENGITINTKTLLALEEEQNKEATRATKRARKVGITCSLGSPKQLAENFKELGLHTGTVGSSGVMSLSKDALLDLVERYPHTKKWVTPILEYRAATKFKGTYVKGLCRYGLHRPDLHEDLMLIRGNLWFPGTVTWRLNSSKPSRLVFPRGKFRTAICSRFPNGAIVSADYSQLELRVLACLSKDPVMEGIYKEGGDIHDVTATHFFGKGYSKNQRSRAKAVNFLIVYGGGPEVMRLNLRKEGILITVEEAARWIKKWKQLYTVAWNYMVSLQTDAMTIKVVQAPNYLIKRRFGGGGKSLKKLAKEGANMPIQCGAAMMTLRAGYILEKSLDPEEGIVVNLVHDEIVLDCPNDGRAASEKLVSSMFRAAKEEPWFTLPVGVDLAIGPTWGTQTEVSY